MYCSSKTSELSAVVHFSSQLNLGWLGWEPFVGPLLTGSCWLPGPPADEIYPDLPRCTREALPRSVCAMGGSIEFMALSIICRRPNEFELKSIKIHRELSRISHCSAVYEGAAI